MLKIKITTDDIDVKNYYEKACIEGSKHEGDAGFDLIATETLTIPRFGKGVINFKISCSMTSVDSWTGEIKYLSYMLVPRSSIHKYNLILANSVGIIDAGYRGNIMAHVRFIPTPEDERDEITIEKGTRLFQIIKGDLSCFKTSIVSELNQTSRGTGGFGSTGEK